MQKKNNKTAVIFASRPVSAGMRRYVPAGALVLAADAGWKNARALGLEVDVAVGDFDSAPPPPGAAELLTLPAEKDDSDTHCAAKLALERGCTSVVLLGAAGGRADHHHANLQTLLHLAKAGARAMMADEESEIVCVGPGSLELEAAGWRWLSVFAAGGPATGVDLAGLRYPLHKAALSPDTPLGLSNEFAAGVAKVSHTSGYLYVMCCHGN